VAAPDMVPPQSLAPASVPERVPAVVAAVPGESLVAGALLVVSSSLPLDPSQSGMQRLIGVCCRAQSVRLLAREKGMPLYKLLRKSNQFSWTAEAQEALDQIKVFLTLPSVLVAPNPSKTLLYVATTTQVIRAALVVERENKGQVLKIWRLV
jgi:hypothetical protein